MDFKIDRNYVMKVIIDTISLIVLVLPILLLNTIATPYFRGFNCDDESIRYPYKTNTIPSYLLYIYGFGIPLTIILATEILNSRENLKTEKEKRLFLWKLYCELIPFFFGVLISQLITDTAKYSIGRLRPSFHFICRPNITCSNYVNYEYITQYRCMNNERDKVEDARLSFMSGHASFSAFCMTYTVFFIHHKIDKKFGLFKKLIQFALLYIAIYTGFTRISDYKHHWSDVLVGWLQGTIVAIIVSVLVAKYHKKRLDKFYHPCRSSIDDI